MDKLAIFSFPRSGRRLTEKILMEQGYCIHEVPGQGYKGGGCTPEAITDVVFTHDYGFNEDYSDAGFRKIVLYRHPVHCFVSWFEMLMGAGHFPGTKRDWQKIVTEVWSPYWKSFSKRHHDFSNPNIHLFDVFTKDLPGYVHFLTGTWGTTNITAHPPRDIKEFVYYDKKEFEGIEGDLMA